MNAVICAIAKNENLYINDGVKWHIDLGFSHIYLYDNNDSKTPFVGNFIDANYKDKVTIFNVNNVHEHAFQIRCYDKFYSENKNNFDGCAFIDIDEFINVPKGKNINEFLSEPRFKNTEAIKLKGHLYGDDDLIERDMHKPVYECFNKILNDTSISHNGKSIVKGKLNRDITMGSAHYASDVNTKEIVKQMLPDGSITTGKIDVGLDGSNDAYINHYMTKSLKEFIDQKFARGDAIFNKRNIDMTYFGRINKQTNAKISYIEKRIGKQEEPRKSIDFLSGLNALDRED